MWGVAMIYQVENPNAVFRVDIDDIMVVIKAFNFVGPLKMRRTAVCKEVYFQNVTIPLYATAEQCVVGEE